MLTKDHASTIAKKLEAEIRPGRAHDIAVIKINGVWVASFGIRHGSRRDQGHDHIPKSIYFPPNKCLRLAQCTLNRPDWIKAMIERGIIKD